MKLSKQILDKVEWYEYKAKSGMFDYYDCIILHFKSWFKCSKTIKILRITAKKKGDSQCYYMSEEYIELKEQLEQYFRFNFD